MRATDIVMQAETERRATALCALAISRDSYLASNAEKAFADRGWGHYLTKSSILSSSDEGVALLPLVTAFVMEVERVSVVGQLEGAVRIPVGQLARLQLGVITATSVSEAQSKPVMRLDFSVGGGVPEKVIAQVVASAEFLRAVDPRTQDGIRAQLVSATAAATDVAFITAATAAAGSPTAGGPAELLAAISGGAPQQPYLIGGYDTLVPLAPTLSDLRALGVGIIPCAAAAGLLVAVDATGILISDSGAEVATARHATLTMENGGSPPTESVVSLWQSNLAVLKAERYLKFAFRSGAVAYSAEASA